jgi:hypothetical protein
MFVQWLKISIPGIILLGTVGSILAVYLLGLGKWLAKRYLFPALEIYAATNVRPYVFARALATRLSRRKESTKLLFFSLVMFICAVISSILFLGAIIFTVFFFTIAFP